jgi:hypothetical protein
VLVRRLWMPSLRTSCGLLASTAGRYHTGTGVVLRG